MADWSDVEAIVATLPGVQTGSSYGNRAWKVGTKTFAWERPLGKGDLAALGETAPDGPILGVRVADLSAVEQVLAEPGACFTIPHFNGYPAVLVRLDDADLDELTELLTEAWLCRAPKRLAASFQASRFGDAEPRDPRG